MHSSMEHDYNYSGMRIAEVPDLPVVLAYGSSSADARSKVEALALRVIADRLENGEHEPI